MLSSLGTVLVYGAGGAQGTAIVRAIKAAGGRPRVLLREGSANPFGWTLDTVRGDMADAARLRLASLGVDKVVLTLPLAASPAMAIDYAGNAIDAAKAAGVSLLVWNTAGVVPAGRTGIPAFDVRMEIAAYLKASGVPSLILKPTLYMGNLTGPWTAPAIVELGVVAYPLPESTQVAWLSWEDLAAFVAAGLQRPELAGRSFDIGGPEALTGEEIAGVLARALGRSMHYHALSLADFAAGLNAGLGGRIGDEVAACYAWLAQHPAALAGDMRPALAALPVRQTRFADWARAQDWRNAAGVQASAAVLEGAGA